MFLVFEKCAVFWSKIAPNVQKFAPNVQKFAPNVQKLLQMCNPFLCFFFHVSCSCRQHKLFLDTKNCVLSFKICKTAPPKCSKSSKCAKFPPNVQKVLQMCKPFLRFFFHVSSICRQYILFVRKKLWNVLQNVQIPPNVQKFLQMCKNSSKCANHYHVFFHPSSICRQHILFCDKKIVQCSAKFAKFLQMYKISSKCANNFYIFFS